MITIYFPKYIRSLTDGAEYQKFDTSDIATVISGLRCLFPKLSLYMTNIDSGHITNICYIINKETNEVLKNTVNGKVKATELVLIITIYGQGDDFGGILVGAALIAASFIPGLQGVTLLGMSVTGSLLTAGISLTLSGVLSLFKPGSGSANTPGDSPVRSQNDAFGSLQNTSSTDMAIPLIFGQVRVAGQFVGGRIKTINHTSSDVISLANYVQ